MKRKMTVIVICAVAVLFIWEPSYGEPLNGFSEGKIHVLMASANGLKCNVNLKVSSTLENQGDFVDVEIEKGFVTNQFMGSATTDNRTCIYTFEKVIGPVIFVDDKEYNSKSMNVKLNKAGRTSVKGRMTLRWKTTAGKVSEGFPMYFYKTVYSPTKTITVNDLGNIDVDSSPQEEEILNDVLGQVSHTDIWRKRGIEFNRRENVYWPGEKFLLKALTTGKDPPGKVTVEIEGTSFKTNLSYNGSSWVGELIDKKMKDMWSNEKELQLVFIFTAYFPEEKCTDQVKVIIDNSLEYFLLHRRE